MRHGSLCTGYGGLDLAVEAVLGGEMAWCAEFDKHASKVIEARFPGVPNLHDLTTIDWAELEPVDVLTAGYPCQPFSVAGKKRGTDDHRHIWPHIADALRVLRPRHAVLENVAGHLALGFDTVLRDLAELGFDAEWVLVRASDVGACHRRERLFILASDAERSEGGPGHDAHLLGRRAGATEQARVGGGHAAADAGGERHGPREDARGVGCVDRLDEGAARQRQRARQEPCDRSAAAPADAEVVAQREPADEADALAAGGEAWEIARCRGRDGSWGEYGDAVERHASVLGRPAPAPVTGEGKLSPRFTEWMMMIPDGWVTDVLDDGPALKALGNGVVPPQAAYALQLLLEREPVAA